MSAGDPRAKVVGGPAAARRLESLLGPGLPPARVTAASSSEGEVRFTLESRGCPPLGVIVCAPPVRGGRYATTSSALALRHEGRSLTRAQERLMERVAAALDRIAFEQLADAIDADDSARRVVERGPDTPARRDGRQARWEEVPEDEWNDADRWRRFMMRREFERNCMSALDVRAPLVSVTHGDLECRFATPPVDGRAICVPCYPWVRPLRGSRSRPRVLERMRADLARHLWTDLGDADVIRGGSTRLGDVLADVAGVTSADDDVVVRVTCLPHVIGEDVESVLDAFGGDARLHLSDPERAGDDDVVVRVLERALSAAPPVAGDPQAVNLLGVREDRYGRELVSMLEQGGVRVNASLLPVVDPARAARWREARTQVVVSDPYMGRIVEKVFVPLDIETVSPPGPWGVESTGRWLAAIARHVGASASMRRLWERRREEARGRLEHVHRAARRHRLGFVGTARELASLSDPLAMAGVDVAGMVAEMGFGVDLLVHGEGEVETGALDPGRTRVHRFREPDELARLLAGLECRAVYSDVFADERITRAGKTPFSLQVFEPGLSGAIATARSLLAACELDFTRRYGRYLARGGS